ncbi:MAG: hypothetical protein R2799_05720 [Crocinitomicaceae bacterium]
MKQILTFTMLLFLPLAFGQSKMEAPTKVVKINNEGNPIRPIQTKNVREAKTELVQIKRSEFKQMPKEKQKLILKEPEKYTIIED